MSTRTTTVRTRQATRAATQPPSQPAEAIENKMNGSGAKAKTNRRATKTYCLCKKPDDGSPMILCSVCNDWYHFHCVDLTEFDAGEIQSYVCPSCHEKTGARIIRDWEGEDAMQDLRTDDGRAYSTSTGTRASPPAPTASTTPSTSSSAAAKQKARAAEADAKAIAAEEQESDVSSDASEEYNPHAERTASGSSSKRRMRRPSYPQDDDDDDGSDSDARTQHANKRIRRASSNPKDHKDSPSASAPAALGHGHAQSHAGAAKKRKKSTAAPPPAKRPRSESTSTGEDAARKYCLTKLQELFRQIFVRYPFLPRHPAGDGTPEGEPGGGAQEEGEAGEERQGEAEHGSSPQPDKRPEDLTVEEKEALEARADAFGAELEACVYELYSEPDKTGKMVVGGKYKERFRMLTFNLAKPDRTVLHTRLASSRLTPRELATLSSTALASEHEQQSIKKLQEAALAHSILKKSIVPRAKITHKGLQDIEDVTGAAQREAEREREEEEEERIERERVARLRVQAQRAPSASASVPPESPVAPSAGVGAGAGAWGAPPPVPLRAASPSPSPVRAHPHANALHALYVPAVADFAAGMAMGEGELNLADLINIDEEAAGEVAMADAAGASAMAGAGEGEGEAYVQVQAQAQVQGQVGGAPPVLAPLNVHASPAPGISPFAAKGDAPSFDLSALWTPGSGAGPAQPQPALGEDAQREPAGEDARMSPAEQQPMDVELLADDRDFDMFLGNADNEDEKEEAGKAKEVGDEGRMQEEREEESQVPEPAVVEPTAEARRAAFDAQPAVWHGILSMPLDSTIPQEVAVSARQAGGRTLGAGSPLWQTLFPATELRIDGRVQVERSAQYLTQVRLNPSKELVAVAFAPAPNMDTSGFAALKAHLIAKGRHGLIFPWGHNPKASAPGRELYVVPLLASAPIPEYMELLDELRLPPERTADYLVGIWVLTKGKLVPPPPPVLPATAAPAALSTHASASAGAGMNIDFAQLQHLGVLQGLPGLSMAIAQAQGHPLAAPTLLPHLLPPSSGASAVIGASGSAAASSSSAPPLPPPSHPNPNPTQELPTLTPEQITLMLQALSKASGAASASASQSSPPASLSTAIPIPGLSASASTIPALSQSQSQPLAIPPSWSATEHVWAPPSTSTSASTPIPAPASTSTSVSTSSAPAPYPGRLPTYPAHPQYALGPHAHPQSPPRFDAHAHAHSHPHPHPGGFGGAGGAGFEHEHEHEHEYEYEYDRAPRGRGGRGGRARGAERGGRGRDQGWPKRGRGGGARAPRGGWGASESPAAPGQMQQQQQQRWG